MKVWIELLLIYLLAVNLVTLVAYWMDKRRAIKHRWRIPEKTLIGLAMFGGSIGALIGIFCLRHKSKHAKFFIGVPLILILQVAATLFLLY